MSITGRIFKGAIWNSISQISSQALNFVFTIFLARLLSPDDFGIIGQIVVFTGLLSYFCEFGLSAIILLQKELDETDRATVFWSMIFFTSLVYIIVYFTAPLIAAFYTNENLTLIIRILFIQFLFVPFSIVNEYLEYRALVYNKIVKAEIISLLLSGIVGVILAFNGFAVWSLIMQYILKTFFRTVILIYITDWRPSFIFSLSRFKEFFKIGSYFTYRNLILYMSENTDFLLIGKLAGASMLGIYNLAFRISNYPFSKIQQIIGQMLFTAFNMISEDTEKVRNNYFRLSNFGGLVLLPFLISIFFGIDSFTILFLGKKWIQSTAIVKILTVYLVFSSISIADDSLMMSLQKIKNLNIIKTFTSLLLLGIGFYATLNYSAIGMAVTFSAVAILYIFIVKILLFKNLHVSLLDYLNHIKFSLLWGVTYLLLMVIYTITINLFIDSPLLFLIGEGIIFMSFMAFVFIKKGIINIKERKIVLEAI